MNIIKTHYPKLNNRNIKPIFKKPYVSRVVKTHSNEITNTIVESSYWIGKSVILFTMFYCTLQWNMYRTIRKDKEDKD